jgi:hypothetical protein
VSEYTNRGWHPDQYASEGTEFPRPCSNRVLPALCRRPPP